MILTNTVEVKIGTRNKDFFEQKGYKLPYSKDSRGRDRVRRGEKIKVKIEDLPKWSNEKILYQCDKCGIRNMVSFYTIFSRKNSEYNKTGKNLCSKCANGKMSGKNSGAYKHGSKRYPEYRNNANRRGIKFDLTPREFKRMVLQPCHYCGGYSKDRVESSRGNGIDRKDSRKGYEIENCVPCCSTCNFVKNKMGYEEFIKYIKTMYEHIFKNP